MEVNLETVSSVPSSDLELEGPKRSQVMHGKFRLSGEETFLEKIELLLEIPGNLILGSEQIA